LTSLRKKKLPITSATVLPGAVTSMTATGFLPQYSLSGQADAMMMPGLMSSASDAASQSLRAFGANENKHPALH
jgi:hypothetical protein